MDKIANAIKCVNCKEVFSKPLILPCGHSICKKHTETEDEKIRCERCESNHLNKGFSVNEALEEIVASQIASMDFGNVHKEARQSCDQLCATLAQIDLILKDPDYYTHEMIDGLINRVHVKSEMLKVQLEEIIQEALHKLQEYKSKCKQYVKSSEYATRKEVLQQENVESQAELDKCSIYLNQLKFDEAEWKKIQMNSDQKCSDLVNKLACFKKLLLLSEFEKNEREVNFFENINLDSIFTIQ